MLIQIIKRAKDLSKVGELIKCMPDLELFLSENVDYEQFNSHDKYINAFLKLDDYDIWASIKMWANHSDKTISVLCNMLLERKLFKIELSDKPFTEAFRSKILSQLKTSQNVNNESIEYFYVEDIATNSAYQDSAQNINILSKDGKVIEISEASDLPTIKALSNIVKKYYICWANDVSL
jgi:uncharacterized protein